MTMVRQSVALLGFVGFLFGESLPAAPADNAPISVSSGGERLAESDRVELRQEFACETLHASLIATFDKTKGVERLELLVGGKPVAGGSLATAHADIRSAGGFDYASFQCSASTYRFGFWKGGNDEKSLVTSISGHR